jgi:hypothetical protein
MDNELKDTQSQPCENCPDNGQPQTPEQLVANLQSQQPPLEYQWALITNDGKDMYQAHGTAEEVLWKDVPTKDIAKFSLQDENRQDVAGIVVAQKAFMLLGVMIYTDLPEGKYEVINIRRSQHDSDGKYFRWYILGLKQIIEPKQVDPELVKWYQLPLLLLQTWILQLRLKLQPYIKTLKPQVPHERYLYLNPNRTVKLTTRFE